jgi:hypothetical protein
MKIRIEATGPTARSLQRYHSPRKVHQHIDMLMQSGYYTKITIEIEDDNDSDS